MKIARGKSGKCLEKLLKNDFRVELKFKLKKRVWNCRESGDFVAFSPSMAGIDDFYGEYDLGFE